MRALTLTALTAALLAGCNSRPTATVNAANSSAGNMAMDAPMNDQSAIESATNAGMALPPPSSEPTPAPSPSPSPSPSPAPPATRNSAAGNAPSPVLGQTRGGDTGGNTVQGNSTRM